MRKIKFWLEIDEAKGEYRHVEVATTGSDGVTISFLDNQNLGKHTKEIFLSHVNTVFTPKYLKIIGFEQTNVAKTYVMKGYYLYPTKPYNKKVK